MYSLDIYMEYNNLPYSSEDLEIKNDQSKDGKNAGKNYPTPVDVKSEIEKYANLTCINFVSGPIDIQLWNNPV